MCQPVYDDEYDDGEMGHGGDEYFDREEELRGYNNRQIDFTLHTILEESCEDSESDRSKGANSPGGRAESAISNRDRRKRQSDPSEMEQYFLYGVGDGTNPEAG